MSTQPYSHPSRIQRLALYGNTFQASNDAFVTTIIEALRPYQVQLFVEETLYAYMQAHLDFSYLADCRTFSVGELPQADVAISIGGDGTFLGTAAKIGASGMPILGINTGRLGFLADVSPTQVTTAFSSLFQGKYSVEAHTCLSVMIDGQPAPHPFTLNEVAVLKHDNSSLIEISTYVNNHFLTSYLADGLIVSTPTGSTGYSLSVGGPILTPGSPTICLSPIAPHSLSIRPVVLSDDVVVRLNIKSRTEHFLLACDGKSQSIPVSSTITVQRAPHTIRVIKICHQQFFDTLREKLMWGADKRL